ncbi:hypothetical protein [Aquibacillus sediminis]|uniref:hypothetical protein n=1 Tax=Aquibacillus sediminis TaxID=2574734 RepID=UPI00148600D8|nr:hypothetical protein [Aquibacillus sediminis]
MKQYIFHLNKSVESKEIKIIASGMLDAFTQVKDLKKKLMQETSDNVDIQFKGTIYSQ